ncbi:MAG TPA: YCF48-related protein [Ignavibacteria bacterium]|nr:YCF48-related protein [Ignavibacteria bacterium]HMR00410.1 YCF48-related protein [Ignavibacteria bacterium]
MKHLFLICLLLPSVLLSQPNWQYKQPVHIKDFFAVKFFDEFTGIAAGSDGFMIKTYDGGNYWQEVKTADGNRINSFCFLNSTNGLAACDNGAILFTTNRGSSWIRRNSSTGNNINFIAEVSFNYLIGACANGVLIKSTNGGLSWSSQNLAGFNLKNIYIINQNAWIASGDSIVILKTTNSGTSWQRYIVVESGYSSAVKGIHFGDIMNGCMLLDKDFYNTTNGGINWYPVSNYIGGGEKMIFLNTTTGYGFPHNTWITKGPIYKTTNCGLNWSIFSSEKIKVCSLPSNGVDVIGNSIIYLCGDDGVILRSSDQCTSFTHIGSVTGNFNTFWFNDHINGIAACSENLLKTGNGADSWKIDAYGHYIWSYWTSVSFNKIKSSDLDNLISVRGTGGEIELNKETVLRSSDGGNTFYGELSAFPFVSDTEIDVIGDTYFTVGNFSFSKEGPQFFKAAGTDDWQLFYTFKDSTFIHTLSFANVNTGIAAGYDHETGLNFYALTTNSGVNWLINNLPQTNDVKKACMLNDGYGYILCDSGMILKSTNFGTNWFIHNPSNENDYKTIFFLDNLRGYAITSSDMLAATSNGGENWSLHDVCIPTRKLNEVQFIDPITGFISGDGVFMKTTNGGLTFFNSHEILNPEKFRLFQNYPNPFNPVTNIKFDIPKSGLVKITVFDMLGREVTSLINQQMQPGSSSVDWDASNYPSGVYFYKLETESFAESKKMVLVK